MTARSSTRSKNESRNSTKRNQSLEVATDSKNDPIEAETIGTTTSQYSPTTRNNGRGGRKTYPFTVPTKESMQKVAAEVETEEAKAAAEAAVTPTPALLPSLQPSLSIELNNTNSITSNRTDGNINTNSNSSNSSSSNSFSSIGTIFSDLYRRISSSRGAGNNFVSNEDDTFPRHLRHREKRVGNGTDFYYDIEDDDDYYTYDVVGTGVNGTASAILSIQVTPRDPHYISWGILCSGFFLASCLAMHQISIERRRSSSSSRGNKNKNTSINNNNNNVNTLNDNSKGVHNNNNDTSRDYPSALSLRTGDTHQRRKLLRRRQQQQQQTGSITEFNTTVTHSISNNPNNHNDNDGNSTPSSNAGTPLTLSPQPGGGGGGTPAGIGGRKVATSGLQYSNNITSSNIKLLSSNATISIINNNNIVTTTTIPPPPPVTPYQLHHQQLQQQQQQQRHNQHPHQHNDDGEQNTVSSADETRHMFRLLLLFAMLARLILIPVQIWTTTQWYQVVSDTFPEMIFASAWTLLVSFFVQLVGIAMGTGTNTTPGTVIQATSYVVYLFLIGIQIFNKVATILLYALMCCIYAALLGVVLYYCPRLISLLQPSLRRHEQQQHHPQTPESNDIGSRNHRNVSDTGGGVSTNNINPGSTENFSPVGPSVSRGGRGKEGTNRSKNDMNNIATGGTGEGGGTTTSTSANPSIRGLATRLSVCTVLCISVFVARAIGYAQLVVMPPRNVYWWWNYGALELLPSIIFLLVIHPSSKRVNRHDVDMYPVPPIPTNSSHSTAGGGGMSRFLGPTSTSTGSLRRADPPTGSIRASLSNPTLPGSSAPAAASGSGNTPSSSSVSGSKQLNQHETTSLLKGTSTSVGGIVMYGSTVNFANTAVIASGATAAAATATLTNPTSSSDPSMSPL